MKFTKTMRGGWLFTIEGQSFEAIRNIAGFAHRDWEVWTHVGGYRLGVQGKCIEDQLASRAECVEVAGKTVAQAQGWTELVNAYNRLAEERESGCAPVGTVEFWQSEVLRLGGSL
jgi:hypothetical protein